MNKHVEDTRYYLKRAAETAKRGVAEELEPVRERVNEITGTEEAEVHPGRIDQVRADLTESEQTAEGEAKAAIADAREKPAAYRDA